MLKRLEAQHKLYGSLEEMLSPETLSELLLRPVSSVSCRPMANHEGLAGGRLDYVDTDAGRLVLKRMSMAHDYIMYTSDDRRCRAVRLWQYGLLDELRPELEHKIVACGRDGDGWGILMHDLSGGLFGWEDHAMPPGQALEFLDRMARLHARFWNDPRLLDPRIGLNDEITPRLKATSLDLAQKQNGDQRGVIPTWVREGWEALETVLEPDLLLHLRHLYKHPQPLLAALRRCPYTLIHNDYRDANLAYLEPDQAVVFDWQQASHGLMTVDLTWFARDNDVIRNLIGEANAVRYYRDRLETYLGAGFDDDTWQAMLGLGHLVNAFMICCFACFFERTDHPDRKAYWEVRIKEQTQSIRDGLRWL